ncbi:protein SSUH2 homolog [Patiria miniata]|uniref:Protein SSUH2 homolog n=1 Tax=Patiria miniata TaxID=46514 RepID=A0A914A5A4_PATMI|nr:protein SSUH2 homolog [Patiria miniata]
MTSIRVKNSCNSSPHGSTVMSQLVLWDSSPLFLQCRPQLLLCLWGMISLSGGPRTAWPLPVGSFRLGASQWLGLSQAFLVNQSAIVKWFIVSRMCINEPWAPSAAAEGAPPHKFDNAADTDREDNENATEGGDVNPDVNSLEPVPGCESVALEDGPPVPPPAYEPPTEGDRPQEVFFDSGDDIGEEAARAAILTFVDEHCCYGSRPAKNMTISKIIPTQGLHYQLETFNEARSTSRKFKPYAGGDVDGPENGAPPPVWSMACKPDQQFLTHKKNLEVPHTSVVKQCQQCNGCGLVTCGGCAGLGRVSCSSCFGSGTRTEYRGGERYTVTCTWCYGSGRETCNRCMGDGRVECPSCEGHKQLRHFIMLTVSYTNNLEDYILERSDMPDELIRNVSGQTIFQQTLPHVWPISQYPIQEVNENSIRLVEKHRTAWPHAMTLQQRQTLRSVPVTEAHYDWKNISTRFWVYGFEHEVHAPDYPHQCCWGCNVL